ncbi:hypothetical protein AL1_24570 [Alistipes shahii WAL 8301]|uniref:Uncharacterized protein n=1 Tax=Alistipes shahii WAL 8301 TaxID=717959 RepID=D4IP17_9BACT|nr:hypothetical protein AL1_24570 [Alistipes shahii WAL 8301]
MWPALLRNTTHWNLNYEKRFLKEFTKKQEQFLKDENKFLKVMKCS